MRPLTKRTVAFNTDTQLTPEGLVGQLVWRPKAINYEVQNVGRCEDDCWVLDRAVGVCKERGCVRCVITASRKHGGGTWAVAWLHVLDFEEWVAYVRETQRSDKGNK